MKKTNYIKLILILLIFAISFIFLPKFFISEKDQSCILNYHCKNLDCSLLNKNFKIGKDLVYYEPLCINNKCECEWPANLLNFDK